MTSLELLHPVRNIGSCVKTTAIWCKRLVTEVTKCPSFVPQMCQEAEKSAFLVLVATIELERKLRAQNDHRLQKITKTAEDLYKLVCNLTALASQLASRMDHEEAHTNFQRAQLTFSERANTLLQLVSTIHLDSITRVSSKDALEGPALSEFEAKGLDMKEINNQKGFAFIFSLAKRISGMVSKIPQDMETLKPDEILECAKDRENCVSLLVNLARKFARSRGNSVGRQFVLNCASRTKLVSTKFFSVQKAIVACKKSSRGQQELQKLAGSFSKELVLLIKSLVQMKGSEQTKNKEIDVWDEETKVGKNIVFDEKDKTQLKCATLNQMIIHLTDPEACAKNQIELEKAFITTFQSFTSSDVLFRKLVQRYHVPRRKFREIDAAEWRYNFVKPLQLRIHAIIVHWIDERFADFNYGMVKKLIAFVDNSFRSDGFNAQADQILSKIRKEIMPLREKDEPVRNLAPNTNVNEVLLAMDEEILAQHFTLHEFRIYQRIQPVELLDLTWSDAKLRHRAPNVMKMIDRANIVCAWVTSMVLSEVGLRDRARMFDKMVSIAQACFDLRNYNTIFAFLAGLNMASVNRLKHTKDELSNNTKVRLEDLKAKMSVEAAYKSVREVLHSGDPPALPYLGVYLTDLTFIEEGNSDYFGEKSTGLINFKKRMYVYRVLSEIQYYQRRPFHFPEDPKIMMCLEHLHFLDPGEIFRLSLLREGRNVPKSDLFP